MCLAFQGAAWRYPIFTRCSIYLCWRRGDEIDSNDSFQSDSAGSVFLVRLLLSPPALGSQCFLFLVELEFSLYGSRGQNKAGDWKHQGQLEERKGRGLGREVFLLFSCPVMISNISQSWHGSPLVAKQDLWLSSVRINLEETLKYSEDTKQEGRSKDGEEIDELSEK